MKKWIFVIFPAAMLAIFLVFWVAEKNRIAEREAKALREKTEKEHQKQIEDAATAAKTKADQEKRSAEMKAATEKEAADRLAAWMETNRVIEEATAKSNLEVKRENDEIAKLSMELTSVRAKTEATNREYLDLALKTTQSLVALRNSELEVQRTHQRLVDRVEQALQDNMPPPPGQGGPDGRGGRGPGGGGGRGGGGGGGGGGRGGGGGGGPGGGG